MKKFLLGALVGFVFTGLVLVITFFVFVRMATRPPDVRADSILVLRLEGSVPESPPTGIPLPFFDRARPTVADTWSMLRKAAADRRIRAVVFMPYNLDAGWGKLQEIRHNLETFRQSGKPVHAYLRAPGTREYYAATAADRIYMAPEDYLDVKGLRAELMYLRGTLDKLGVRVEIVHAGRYKDAPDMFTRTDPRPETREVVNSVLDTVYADLLETIGRARNKTAAEARAIVDRGPFIAPQAVDEGLVDGLRYEDQVFDELKQQLNLREVRRVAPRTYMRVTPESAGLRPRHRIALVVADGNIVRDEPAGILPAEGFVSPGEFNRALRRAVDDREIRGVIVRIDSPGGDAFAADEIWREMNLATKKKPIVISMSDTAASGGYYMAMTGDRIVAYPGTYTGSIGVYYGKANLRGLYDKIGVNKELMSRGRFAEIDSDYTPLGPEGIEKLRRSIDHFYQSFVQRVAEARQRSFEEIDQVAQGRVWLGTQATNVGLVDTLGGLDSAIEILKEKADIPREEQVRLVMYPRRRGLFERLTAVSAQAGTGWPHAVTDPRLAALLRRFAISTWREGGVLRLMPYDIDVR